MGDVTVRLMPPFWAVGECEGYYESMAAKGWLLQKRGVLLDTYRRGMPRKLRYRLEIAGSSLECGILPLPQEQLQLYEECGWTLAARRREVYVFQAAADSGIPEIYNEDAQHAAMLAGLKKHYLGDLISVLFWIGWLSAAFLIRRLNPISCKAIAEADCLLGFLLSFWLLMTWRAFHGAAMIRLLLNRLKKGKGIDRRTARKNRHLMHRMISGALSTAALFCLTGGIAEAMLRNTSPLPESGRGMPYLLGGEMFEARRASEEEAVSFGRAINYVKSTPTLFSPVQYHTNEYLVPEGGGSGVLYQDVYAVRSHALAEKLAWSLAADSTFSPREGYVRTAVSGLDLALVAQGGLELIAVKDKTVVYAVYIGFPEDASARLLAAYAETLQRLPENG